MRCPRSLALLPLPKRQQKGNPNVRWTIEVFQIVGDDPSLPPAQASFQFLRAWAGLPRAVAAKGDEVSHFPGIGEDRFDPAANSCRQRPQDGHGKLGEGLLESRKACPGTFSLGTTDDVKPASRLELLGQAVAATVGGQQENVEQRGKSQRGDFLRFVAFRTCLKTAGVRNSRIDPINNLVRRRWRPRFLARATCRSSMIGLVF